MESFLCWGRLYFSLPIQLPQSNIIRNATSVEFAQNTIGDHDGKLFERQWIRKLPRWYKKYYWPALVKNTNIAQCRPRNKHSCAMISGEVYPQISVGCSLRSMSAIVFLFNPWIIFGWYRLGNVRLASFGDAFWDTSTGNLSLANVGKNFFRSKFVEDFILELRSAIFFFAYSISAGQGRPKNNVGWVRTKYHRRPRW